MKIRLLSILFAIPFAFLISNTATANTEASNSDEIIAMDDQAVSANDQLNLEDKSDNWRGRGWGGRFWGGYRGLYGYGAYGYGLPYYGAYAGYYGLGYGLPYYAGYGFPFVRPFLRTIW